jgi:hypothetical protein
VSFNDLVTAGQDFAEQSDLFGESFTYGGATLAGVFNQVDLDYRFDEFSVRKVTALVCVTSKAQWTTAGVAPADRGLLTYGGVGYSIQNIAGSDTSAEPAYTLTLVKLT